MEADTKIIHQITQEFIEGRPLSASSMKAFRKSPKHYIEYLFGEKKEREAYTMGNLVDYLLTQPENFDKLVMPYERPNLRTNAGKDEMQQIQDTAAKNNLQLATPAEIKAAMAAVESALSVDMVRELIEGRVKGQIPLNWRNKRHNLPLKGHADLESKAWGEDWLVEVKTTGKEQGADPDIFWRDAIKLGYDIQIAAYLDAYKHKFYKFPNAIFIVIEVVEPFNCAAIFCDSKFLERAKAEWIGTLAAFRYCMNNNLFHQGYEFRLHTLPYFTMNYPAWHKPVFGNFDIDALTQ